MATKVIVHDGDSSTNGEFIAQVQLCPDCRAPLHWDSIPFGRWLAYCCTRTLMAIPKSYDFHVSPERENRIDPALKEES
jgi:hypothetical protein